MIDFKELDVFELRCPCGNDEEFEIVYSGNQRVYIDRDNSIIDWESPNVEIKYIYCEKCGKDVFPEYKKKVII